MRVWRVMALVLVLTAACSDDGGGDEGGSAGATSTTASSTTPSTMAMSGTSTPAAAVDASRLPIGTPSTSPTKGSVFACQSSFGGGGASGTGPWLHDGTWDSTAKLHVQGAVRWPEAEVTTAIEGDRRVITTKGLPVDNVTGTFPVAASDPAYQYDRNPNRIAATSLTWSLPRSPTMAATPACLNMGAIGLMVDGVFLFNALDAAGRDAAAYEVLDTCDGHPERSGAYHRHSIPTCLSGKAEKPTLVGYALDGYGIYVERAADGKLLTNADLDECHGRVSEVPWDGTSVAIYHYVATLEYPYTIGCFKGAPARSAAAG